MDSVALRTVGVEQQKNQREASDEVQCEEKKISGRRGEASDWSSALEQRAFRSVRHCHLPPESFLRAGGRISKREEQTLLAMLGTRNRTGTTRTGATDLHEKGLKYFGEKGKVHRVDDAQDFLKLPHH